MKRCKKCGLLKPLDEFYRAKGMKDGHRSECKVCFRAQHRVWYAANREKVIEKVRQWRHENPDLYSAGQRQYRSSHREQQREGHLRRTFGITSADYEALLTRQGGGCALCGKRPGEAALHVDHDHETGVIRGLLCVGCNNALGQFRDDPALLQRAVDYVSCEVAPFADVLPLTARARARAGGLRASPV